MCATDLRDCWQCYYQFNISSFGFCWILNGWFIVIASVNMKYTLKYMSDLYLWFLKFPFSSCRYQRLILRDYQSEGPWFHPWLSSDSAQPEDRLMYCLFSSTSRLWLSTERHRIPRPLSYIPAMSRWNRLVRCLCVPAHPFHSGRLERLAEAASAPCSATLRADKQVMGQRHLMLPSGGSIGSTVRKRKTSAK